MNEEVSATGCVAHERRAKHLRIISAFAASVRGQGYAAATVEVYQRVVEHCSRWLATRALSLAALDEPTVEEFLHNHLPNCGCRRPAPKDVPEARWVLGRLLSFLRQRRLVTPTRLGPRSAAERLMARYDRYLSRVCGLTDQTRRLRRCQAWQFLRARFDQRPLVARQLKPGDVYRFMEQRATEIQTGSMRTLATSLRSFLEFLQVAGLAREHLALAVDCPAPAPRNPLVQTLSEVQVRSFLRSFDQRRAVGRRDFAMALCFCRLGLRAQEVARLEVGDLDWQNLTLHLRETKSRRGRVLPLPLEVAQAIAQYLSEGRPRTRTRVLFARHRVPGQTRQGVHLVQSAMRRGFVRAGLGRLGVHRLRHTFATRLHRRGTHIKIIADLLGHKVLDTTARYARVNLEELRQACLPWPKG